MFLPELCDFMFLPTFLSFDLFYHVVFLLRWFYFFSSDCAALRVLN